VGISCTCSFPFYRKESEINMASIVTRSYACDMEGSGKGRKEGVRIETNKNKNRDRERKRE
jgi:hypothetical protein